jgi:hypothetical protein
LKQPEIQYCEPDYEVELTFAPNDPLFQACEQWGFEKIELEAAWEFSRGDSGRTIVGVMDTGVDLDHPDLKDTLWVNPGIVNGVDLDYNGFEMDVHGWDGVQHDGHPDDTGGHGTHVAGIIGATLNNGQGVAGIGQPKIMVLRFIGDRSAGSMSVAQVLLNYAIMNGAKISGMSFGSRTVSKNTHAVFEYAMRYNHIMVIAAGNDGTDNDIIPFYPCNIDLPNIICVGASDENDGRAYFSNWGKRAVDVFAPGHHIMSTAFNPSDLGQQYGLASGTSQAAPFVAGLCALVWDFKPYLNWQQVINIVTYTADVLPGLSDHVRCGRINARRAMQAAQAGIVPTYCGQVIPDVMPGGGVVQIVYKQVLRPFAILTASSCVESLAYGPNPVTEASGPYFSTAYASVKHSKWVQRIKPLGVDSAMDVEITYQFSTEKTLSQRLDDATVLGEKVTWTIKYNFNKERVATSTATKYGTFWFSDNSTYGTNGAAPNLGAQSGGLFSKLQSFGSMLSGDDGAWGAGTGNVNGNCVVDQTFMGSDDPYQRRTCAPDFFGILVDHYSSSDAAACPKLYMGNMNAPTEYTTMRVYMYLETTIEVTNANPPAAPTCIGGRNVNKAAGHSLSFLILLPFFAAVVFL